MNWKNHLTTLLQIDYPIIQAPMLGVTSPEMAAAISNAGGLGSLPVGGLSPKKTHELIQKTKTLTNKPFAVNLFVHTIQQIDVPQAEKMIAFLDNIAADYNLDFEKPHIENLQFYSYKDQIDILINENIPIVSFTFGIPDDNSIKLLKEKNIVLIGTATSVEEAKLLEQKGVDAITVQGIEAGGHRGSFIKNEPLPQVGLMALLPQIADTVNLPLLASGAINDGRTIKAAFALGAAAVQIGTAFIASHESSAIPSYKTALAAAADTDTTLTKIYSGRWARGIKNEFIKLIRNSGISIPDYPIQNSLTTSFRAKAQQQDNNQFTNMWAGQSAFGAQQKPAADIFWEMVKSTEKLT